jgi:uncharacterized protein involved in response to NO
MPTTTADRIRRHSGPAILGLGFRPFFLAGALWSAVAMLVWLFVLTGLLPLPSLLGPVDWHVHELLYGYLPAIVAGFLLTAVPNWTGRLPVTGGPLLALVAVWVVGRLAIAMSLRLGAWLTAVLDLAFLAVLIAVIARELVAGANKRNLPVLLLVSLLFAGNAVFHLELARHGSAVLGTRLGIAAILLLLMLIGGRIVPSFTRNWLAKRGPGRLPASIDLFDGFAIAFAGLALLSWLASPMTPITAIACLAAGLLHLARLARWAGDRTLAEPLVTILHIGYAFVPLGFLLVAAAYAVPAAVQPIAAVHAWTAGGIGTMTLAVMTRASLGHSGRPLAADRWTSTIYVLVVGAALARVAAGTSLGFPALQHLAATLWVLAFATFAIAYWPALTHPRASVAHSPADRAP